MKRLRLDSCYIASHLRACADEVESWKMRTQDWKQHPVGAYGFASPDDRIYTFPGTWDTVLDTICTSLPNLEEFQFGFMGRGGGLYFQKPDTMPTDLHKTGYITIDTGLLPSLWIEAEHGDGEMFFLEMTMSVFGCLGQMRVLTLNQIP